MLLDVKSDYVSQDHSMYGQVWKSDWMYVLESATCPVDKCLRGFV